MLGLANALPNLIALAVWGGVATYMLNLQRKNALAAERIIADDYRRYGALWSRLTSEEDFRQKLHTLEKSIEQARVHNYEPKSSKDRALRAISEARSISGCVRPRQYVNDLAVLLAQAATLNPYFQEVVASRLGRYGVHRAAAIKTRTRAIEKLYRSYCGDCSRLLDLVRSMVTFNEIDSLIAAIDSIRDDPSLIIIGSKNSLSLKDSARDSAGYRNAQAQRM